VQYAGLIGRERGHKSLQSQNQGEKVAKDPDSLFYLFDSYPAPSGKAFPDVGRRHNSELSPKARSHPTSSCFKHVGILF
jgi:hypothetical protein